MRQWPGAENKANQFSSFYRYSVIARGAVYGLRMSANDYIFAVFNKKASRYMHQLEEMGAIRLEGLISQAQFLAAREEAATALTLDINVYGKREDACKAGDILSRSGVCLQQPVCGLEHHTYYNPHFLHVDDFLGLGPAQETPRFKLDMKTDTKAHEVDSKSPTAPVPEQDDASADLSNVLSSLSHHNILSKKTGAVALKSELKE